LFDGVKYGRGDPFSPSWPAQRLVPTFRVSFSVCETVFNQQYTTSLLVKCGPPYNNLFFIGRLRTRGLQPHKIGNRPSSPDENKLLSGGPQFTKWVLCRIVLQRSIHM
jgi:hypothetical protein